MHHGLCACHHADDALQGLYPDHLDATQYFHLSTLYRLRRGGWIFVHPALRQIEGKGRMIVKKAMSFGCKGMAFAIRVAFF